ncbi:MAG: hypothetical protein CMA18_000360 [Methanobacteriota archaeon]|nr:MAG: hypothetical protein CBC63_04430 [Euryarchaeota archaeon TMED103]RAH12750.1 MAG: hypothetical protein CMA18_000360 [Euryarchaeota archaeon]|tara:strand:+ start:2502 stop:3554 length:1053 start_codon:yes stop_codon:yes gene_type:complete
MGITAMIPGTTIDGLLSEGKERWQDIFDADAMRMQVMLICPRKERKILEMHGDMVEHGQPVIGVFHRPRAEARLLEEQGLNPRDASFEFLDLATTDLGPWMQHMITSEQWIRGSISIQPVPFSVDVPAQRAFENITMICFRHPSLPAIERYYLPFPPTSIPNKCFVSLPRRQAAELARQQAEILGVGRAAEPATPEPVMQEDPITPSSEPTAKIVDVDEVEIEQPDSVPLPTVETNHSEGPQSVSDAITKATTDGFEEMQAAGEELEVTKVPFPSVAHETEPTEKAPPPVAEEPKSEIEVEFRALVTELIANGIEPSDMVDDPRWDSINERAAAVDFETWPVFMELTSVE